MQLHYFYSNVLILCIAYFNFAKCNSKYRLPSTIWPSKYVLEIKPNFEYQNVFTFHGNVLITLSTNEENIQQIKLHSLNLDISSNITLSAMELLDNLPVVIKRDYDVDSHINTFELNKVLAPKVNYYLNMTFYGNLNGNPIGFYTGKYTENNTTKWFAMSKFEPIHARRAFPCFDEPRFKANFILTVSRPSNFRPTISNTRIGKTEYCADRNLVRETFKETPTMSTYLLVFAISEFEMRENMLKTINIYSRPGVIEETAYGLEIAEKALNKFNQLFDYDYFSVRNMEKLSLFAAPAHISSAMENWGLITFMESYLLYNQNTSSINRKQMITTTIIHEETHQWFGNLVTCDEFSYIWLNEAFAKYFGYFMAAEIDATLDIDLKFVVELLQEALRADAMGEDRSMSLMADSPQEIVGKFGAITYSKGASFIRMTRNLMGDINFTNGLRAYLRENQLKTATPDKLFNALQLFTKHNLTEMLEPWTTQPGYPLITVNVDENRRKMKISQRRFFFNKTNHNDDLTWNVPLNYATANENSDFSNTTFSFIFKRHQIDGLDLEMNDTIDWIVFNVQEIGFYRVNYDEVTWDKISAALMTEDIHVLNRAQIIDDSIALSVSGIISMERAYNNIRFLKNEYNYLPWRSLISHFKGMTFHYDAKLEFFFKTPILWFIEKIYEKVVIEYEPYKNRLNTLKRINLNRTDYLLNEMSTRFEENIIDPLYCSMDLHFQNTEWYFNWHFYTLFASENQLKFTNIFGCTRKSEIILEYLAVALVENIPTDNFTLITIYRENLHNIIDILLSDPEENQKLLAAFPIVYGFRIEIMDRFVNVEKLETFKEFINKYEHSFDVSEHELLHKTIQHANENLEWIAIEVGHKLNMNENFV